MEAWKGNVLGRVWTRGTNGPLQHKTTVRDRSRIHGRSVNGTGVWQGGNERAATIANGRNRPFAESTSARTLRTVPLRCNTELGTPPTTNLTPPLCIFLYPPARYRDPAQEKNPPLPTLTYDHVKLSIAIQLPGVLCLIKAQPIASGSNSEAQ